MSLGRGGDVLQFELVDTMGFMSAEGGITNEDVTTVLDGKAENKCAVRQLFDVCLEFILW